MPLQQNQAEDLNPFQAAPLTGTSSRDTATAATETPRYDTASVQQILFLAQEMQARHRETLTPDDVEALGQEIGVEPEFVRKALAQIEKGGLSAHQKPRRKHLRAVFTTRRPLSFRAITMTAVVPLLYALFLFCVTSYRPEDNFAKWFVLLYSILPPLLAFGSGFTRRRWRLGMAAGAFWGLGHFFALIFPNNVKLYQELAAGRNAGPYQPFSEIITWTAWFLGVGAAFGMSGALMRRIVEKGVARYRAHNKRALIKRQV